MTVRFFTHLALELLTFPWNPSPLYLIVTVVVALPRAPAVLAIASAPHSSATIRAIESFFMSPSSFAIGSPAPHRAAQVNATLHPAGNLGSPFVRRCRSCLGVAAT